MIITDSAKIMLNEAIKNSQNDCVHVMLQQSCCGEGIFRECIINCVSKKMTV